jgi:excisionase family DNA binding protein
MSGPAFVNPESGLLSVAQILELGPLTYSPAEAAQLTGATESWLRKRSAAGVIPSTRFGSRNLRFSRDDVAGILAVCRQEATLRRRAGRRSARWAS